MALTGKIDFRKGIFGSVVLLVEEDVKPVLGRKMKRRWRRATLIDLAQPELRILIDMRANAHFSTRTAHRAAPAVAGAHPALPQDSVKAEGMLVRMAH